MTEVNTKEQTQTESMIQDCVLCGMKLASLFGMGETTPSL